MRASGNLFVTRSHGFHRAPLFPTPNIKNHSLDYSQGSYFAASRHVSDLKTDRRRKCESPNEACFGISAAYSVRLTKKRPPHLHCLE
jgi:hypothetical protein